MKTKGFSHTKAGFLAASPTTWYGFRQLLPLVTIPRRVSWDPRNTPGGSLIDLGSMSYGTSEGTTGPSKQFKMSHLLGWGQCVFKAPMERTTEDRDGATTKGTTTTFEVLKKLNDQKGAKPCFAIQVFLGPVPWSVQTSTNNLLCSGTAEKERSSRRKNPAPVKPPQALVVFCLPLFSSLLRCITTNYIMHL